MNQPFKKRTFLETLTALCYTEPKTYVRKGKLNQTAIGRAAKCSQSTVNRWLDGTHDPEVKAVKALSSTFSLNTSQILGELPIQKIDGFGMLGNVTIQEFWESSSAEDRAEFLLSLASNNLK